MKDSDSSQTKSFSRRTFIKSLGTSAVATAAARAHGVAAELEKVNGEQSFGPGAVPVTLKVNGETLKLRLEPRTTLLDALRNYSSLTGAKEGCDRASCGACTVLMGDLPVYSCQKLAIEAQNQPITTVEGLARNGELAKVQKAFLEKDALMCGYCTPGFLMSVAALLKKYPRPTADQIRRACAGNLCRCGTQPRIIEAVLHAAGLAAPRTTQTAIVDYAKLA
jgi:aerobic-type carbon monoxide dehydrogenase small subunit (CoxS/CutS family)